MDFRLKPGVFEAGIEAVCKLCSGGVSTQKPELIFRRRISLGVLAGIVDIKVGQMV